MSDRIDIDALLIGALYGELSSTEEARLTAHLESHPADRVALEDLKSARQAVRDSRFFAVQAEPPQPISAILLQEAARRAPKRVRERDDGEQQSWFARFLASFARHPAAAAAAMLVLVLGVAGTLALKGGVKDSVKEAKEDLHYKQSPAVTGAVAQEQDKAPVANPTAPEAQGSAAQGQLDSFSADLKMDERSDRGGKGGKATPKPAYHASATTTAKAPAKKKLAGIEVEQRRESPKDLEESSTLSNADQDGVGVGTATGSTAGGGGGFGIAQQSTSPAGRAPQPGMIAPQQQPPPPPPPAPRTVTKNDAKPAPTPSKTAKDDSGIADKEIPANDASTTEVRKMHANAQAYARNGQCTEAARIVLAIERSNLGYYNANVATDRVLKGCQTYVAKEREKARAAEGKRARSVDEASPAPAQMK